MKQGVNVLALPATKSVTFRTESGHMYNFAQRGKSVTWSSFSTSLPLQAGRILKIIGRPKVGEPLKFAYRPINGDGTEFFIVTTSPIISII